MPDATTHDEELLTDVFAEDEDEEVEPNPDDLEDEDEDEDDVPAEIEEVEDTY